MSETRKTSPASKWIGEGRHLNWLKLMVDPEGGFYFDEPAKEAIRWAISKIDGKPTDPEPRDVQHIQYSTPFGTFEIDDRVPPGESRLHSWNGPTVIRNIGIAPKPPDHHQEVFFNKFESTKAVVCSCGFATTYTTLSNDADELGMAHFERMHEAHIGRTAG